MFVFDVKFVQAVDKTSDKHGENELNKKVNEIKTAINNDQTKTGQQKKQDLNNVDDAYKNKRYDILANYAAMYKLTEIENFFKELQRLEEQKAQSSRSSSARSSPMVTAFIKSDEEQRKKSVKKREQDIAEEHKPGRNEFT